MDSKTIETLAINAVRDSVAMSDFLHQFIKDNDKEPFWDGFVYIYKSKNKKKETFAGRVAVQVKGIVNNNFNKKEISFSVEIVDLKKYLKDGVIFFVVYINNNREKKVYYAELTPIKLRLIISEADNQKEKSIKLKEFPNDGNKKATIFFNFYENSKMQSSFCDAQLFSLEDFQGGVLEEIIIPVAGFGIDPQKAILTNEVYIYAKTKGSAIPQPLGLVPEKIQTTQQLMRTVSINDVPFYNSYTIIRNAEETKIKIGDSFTITFNESEKDCKINYKDSEKIRSIVKDLEFILTLLDVGKFEIEGMSIRFEYNNVNFRNFNIEEEKKKLNYCKKIVHVLDLLGVNGDLIVSTLSNHDWHNINILISALIDKKPVSGLKPNLDPVVKLTVGKYKFALILLNCKDKKNTYFIYDFFEKKLNVQHDKNGECYPISQYFVLKAKDFIEISNIRFDDLLPSYQCVANNHYAYQYANSTLLELLLAYDKTNGSKPILLKTAKDFAEWLMNAPEEALSYEIRFLNKMQVIRREREFTINEIEELFAIIKDTTSEEILVGTYLLLGYQEKAEFHFKKLDPKLQEEFRKYPIFKFWEKI